LLLNLEVYSRYPHKSTQKELGSGTSRNAHIFYLITKAKLFEIAINEFSDKLQVDIPALETWFEKWKIAINPSKSQFIVFSKKKFVTRNISMLGVNIPRVKDVIYLGVTLDQRLSFSKHISNSISKSQGAFCGVYPLLNPKSKLKLRTKIHLYKSLIRPILTYACPAWGHAPNTHLKKIQVKQNKILRHITQAPQYMRNNQNPQRHKHTIHTRIHL
jgi:hypothetical protein